jgi:RNA polymerase sigma-70 factor (ECF subfamily)
MKGFMSSRITGSMILPFLRATSATDPDNRRVRLEDEVTSLFDQFRNPLLRYLWNLGLTLPDSEEILQDVFLSLFQHLNRGKPLYEARGWLFRVAHNLALKRRGRSRRDSESLEEACVESLAIDPAPNPEDRLARSETRQRLMAVVRALPEQDRRCLFLRAEGLRYSEIAGVLDMSPAAISLSLSRSLARLARSAERYTL